MEQRSILKKETSDNLSIKLDLFDRSRCNGYDISKAKICPKCKGQDVKKKGLLNNPCCKCGGYGEI